MSEGRDQSELGVSEPSFVPELPWRTSWPDWKLAAIGVGAVALNTWFLRGSLGLALLVTGIVAIATIALDGVRPFRPTFFRADGVMFGWRPQLLPYHAMMSADRHKTIYVRVTLHNGRRVALSMADIQFEHVRECMVEWLRAKIAARVFE